MKRQINSLFFMAALLLFVAALASCGSKGGEAQAVAETTENPVEEAIADPGAKAYKVAIVRTTPVTNTSNCSTTSECWSYDKNAKGPASIAYCSVNTTTSSGTLNFSVFSGGTNYPATGAAPTGTTPNQKSTVLGLPEGAEVDSISYSFHSTGVSSTPPVALSKCQ